MARTIAVALQKGGIGKSTTSLALASTLGAKGYRVLLIDMDAQGNTTYASGIVTTEISITDVLDDGCPIGSATVSCKYYDLLPADSYLTNVESADRVNPTLLREKLQPIQDKYDYIVIDTPPALGNLSYNSLVAADYVVIPTDPRPFALQGLAALNDTIQNVQKNHRPDLQILGILLVRYNSRTVLNRDIKDMIENYSNQMNTTVFDTTIREGIAVPEAQIMQQPLLDYAKNSKPNQDYIAFTEELLKKLEV